MTEKEAEEKAKYLIDNGYSEIPFDVLVKKIMEAKDVD